MKNAIILEKGVIKMTKSQIDNLTDKADLQVSIPKQLKREVKAIAARQDKTIGQVVAELLAVAIAQQPKQTA
jgi:D-arabinose 5-phosphate isomerase GutQ